MKTEKLPATLGAALALFACPALCAQTTPAAAATAADRARSDVVELSPFTVTSSQDVGYVAGSSLMGGRLNTSLQDTAVSVSVLTQELLQDIASNNFQDAAEWSVNAVTRYYDEPNPYNDYGVNFRGLAGGYNSRNYFRWYANSDAFLTERYDLARGPNSIVFGDAGLGGGINVSPKRARREAAREVHLRWRAFENGQSGHRYGIDVNQPLGEKFEVRGVYLKQNFNEWMNRTATDLETALVTFNYRPFRNTLVWGESEYGYQTRVAANRPTDQSSRWDGSTLVSSPLTAGNFPGGLSRHTTDRVVFVPAAPNLGLQNWRNWASTAGTNIRLRPDPWQPAIPGNPTIPSYDYSLQASNAEALFAYRSHSLFVEQRIGENLWAEVAANYFDQRRDVNNAFFNTAAQQVDVNRLLPNGQPNPFLGQEYVDTQVSPENQTHEQWEFRANLAYIQKLEVAELRYLLGLTRRDDIFDVNRFRWLAPATTNPDINASINQLWIRRYASHADQPFVYPAGARYVRRNNHSSSRKQWDSLQAVVSGSWFQTRRLKTLVGYRRDHIQDRSAALVLDPVSNEFLEFGPRRQTLDVNVDNISTSAVYEWTNWLRTYASFSESYDFSSSATALDGGSIPPITSSGYEFGVRVSLLDNQLHASLAYYDSQQENRREAGSTSQINTIWERLTGAVDTVPTYNDTSSWKARGVELEVVANPTRNLRLSFNLALPHAEQTDGFQSTKAYFAANLPAWNRLLAGVTDTAIVNTVNSNISTIRNRIEGFAEGRTLNGNFDYTANALATYTFREGRLKGLGVGGGVNFRGDRLVGNQLGDSFSYIHAEGFQLASAWASYSTKIFGQDLRWQLNVSNLFDERAVQPTSGGFATVNIGGTTTFRQTNYTLQAPRSYTLTLTTRSTARAPITAERSYTPA